MRFSSVHVVRRAIAMPAVFAALMAAGSMGVPDPMQGQTAAAATAAGSTRLIGTVRSVSATEMTLAKDDGTSVVLTLASAVRVQLLPAGSTDIKAAQDATTADIAVGDRVLVAARSGDAGVLSASRVVLMKSAAIAETNATRQADWQKRGSGGLVTAVDPAEKTISVSSGSRRLSIQASSTTVFRRYAPGSVKFEDAKVGTLADIHTGDQLRVRGSKDVDTGKIAADEIVTGSFRNVAGLVASIDTSASTLILKDLATKKNVTVAIGPDSDLRALPPETAARFAARTKAGMATSTPTGQPPATATATTRQADAGATSSVESSPNRPASGSSSDLSQVVPRLPKITLAALKPGEAIMVVGSGDSSAGSVTAITLLSGVEPLLAASPSGASSFNLSPWSLGGGDAAAGTQ